MSNIKLELNTIYNMDFREGLKLLRDKQVEYTIITDPPYNIGYDYDEYDDTLSDDEYVELISSLKHRDNSKIAIIHYPEETMKYFVKALGVPDEVNVWAYNSNLPGRHHRLINYYGVKPDYTKVLQPYKN